MRTEDGYIVQACLEGDSAAFGLLVDRYKKSIYALAYSRVRNFHDAQDITQEAFLKAYKNLSALKRWDNFMGWLYRITVNLCKDWGRSKARRPDDEFVDDQDAEILDYPAMGSYREGMVFETVQEALDSLPDMYRQVLTLRYFGGMNIRDISRFLGTSPSTIDRRLRIAKSQLKEEVLGMMGATSEQHGLLANFTFRIVEMVKRIRIHAIPKSAGLPWGLSLAAGIILAAMALGPRLTIYETPRQLAFLSEIETPEVRDISVDILRASQISAIAGRQGNIDGDGIDPQNPQDTVLLDLDSGGGTWTRKADMPTARQGVSIAVVDGIVYAIGDSEGLDAGDRDLSTVEAYDPATDMWTTKADIPTAKRQGGVCVADGRIYVFGGSTEDDYPFGITATVDVYDPATDIWTQSTDMPTPRAFHSASMAAGKIYLVGGVDAGVGACATVDVYDPAADTWTTAADPPTVRGDHTASVVDGRIYVIGGFLGPGSPALPTVEEFEPGLPNNIAVIQPSRELGVDFPK